MDTTSLTKPIYWTLPQEFIYLLRNDSVQAKIKRDELDLPLNPIPNKYLLDFPVDPLRILVRSGQIYTSGWFYGRKSFKAEAEVFLDTPLVYLYFSLTRGIRRYRSLSALPGAWYQDPVATMKIILQARSIHEGKGLDNAFYRCAGWLWDNHPRTLLANLHLIVNPTCRPKGTISSNDTVANRQWGMASDYGVAVLDDDGEIDINESIELDRKKVLPSVPHGRFKDLIDLLILAINGQLTQDFWREEFFAINQAIAPNRAKGAFKTLRLHDKALKNGRIPKESQSRSQLRKKAFSRIGIASHLGLWTKNEETSSYPDKDLDTSREKFSKVKIKGEVYEPDDCQFFQRQLARCSTRQARIAALDNRLNNLLKSDTKFQALYLAVVDLFVSFLQSDLALLDSHRSFCALPFDQREAYGFPEPSTSPYLLRISYAAKWAPTPAHGADKQLHLATALALKIFPNLDTKVARVMLQKGVLTPLRSALQLPEIAIAQSEERSISYPALPARAIRAHMKHFLKKDRDRFASYLFTEGKTRPYLTGELMMPHDVLHRAYDREHDRVSVGHIQWDALVASIASRKTDTKRVRCTVVPSVSFTMKEEGLEYDHLSLSDVCAPIWKSLSMSLLLLELTEPPWNSSFITFSTEPVIESLNPASSLAARVSCLMNADCDFIDYSRVYELVLQKAIASNLKPDEMVQKIFVFCDESFEKSASAYGRKFGAEEYTAVCRMYSEIGYPVPELVFWNLVGTLATPIIDVMGVTILTGFSEELLEFYFDYLFHENEDNSSLNLEETKINELTDASKWDEVHEKEETIIVEEQILLNEEGKLPREVLHEFVMRKISSESFNGVTIID